MLDLLDVIKQYPRCAEAVLCDLSLSAEGGELCVVRGESTAGKTTLLRLIAGFELATQGRVTVLSCELSRLRAASLRRLRTRLGVLPQEIRLAESDSVRENILVPLRLRGAKHWLRQYHGEAIIEELGLEPLVAEPVFALSTAERQLVCVARALVGEPEIVVVDEPTLRLDKRQARCVEQVLIERVARGALVVAATSESRLFAGSCLVSVRRFFLRCGQLFAEGSAEREPRFYSDSSVPNVVPFPVRARAGGEK